MQKQKMQNAKALPPNPQPPAAGPPKQPPPLRISGYAPGFKPPFFSAKFSLLRSIFAQINGCHIFQVETQNRIIREPHFLLNLS